MFRLGRTDWSGLHLYDRVAVHEGKEQPYEAVIDVLTEDATLILVLPAQSGRRSMFHYADDVDIDVTIFLDSPTDSLNSSSISSSQVSASTPKRHRCLENAQAVARHEGLGL
jgi:hypothetical protein